MSRDLFDFPVSNVKGKNTHLSRVSGHDEAACSLVESDKFYLVVLAKFSSIEISGNILVGVDDPEILKHCSLLPFDLGASSNNKDVVVVLDFLVHKVHRSVVLKFVFFHLFFNTLVAWQSPSS